MKDILSNIAIRVNDRIYLKDPASSDLGRRIVEGSISMIDEIGFECFTFRKLAQAIDSTEASIYRYFENKHKLLLYLMAWYWGWMEYKLAFAVTNVSSPVDKLEKAIDLLTERVEEDGNFAHIDEIALDRIVISESSKVYLTREVDLENKEGVFAGFKNVVRAVSEIIEEVNPAYPFPHMLISTMIEGIHHQRFFAEHLPVLTDTLEGKDAVCSFYKDMVFKAIGANYDS